MPIHNIHAKINMASSPTPPLPELERFRDNLIKAMTAKHMSASDVARAVWGTKTNNLGREVARNRDRMTWYMAGKGYPRPETVPRLAEVLDLDPKDLERGYNGNTSGHAGTGVTSLPAYRAAREPTTHGVEPGTAPFTFTVLPDRDVLVDFHLKLDGVSAMRLLDTISALIPELRRETPSETDDAPED
jgi:hypothetical protein